MKRLLLLTALAAIAVVLLLPAKASAAATYCNMWNIGQTCTTPWNGWNVAQINNGGVSTQAVHCFAHHTDGSWTGGEITVHGGGPSGYLPTPGNTINGYVQIVCQFTSGAGGFPIAIYSYT